MNMQTQWLDQMMNDSDMSLEDNLIELEEMPENDELEEEDEVMGYVCMSCGNIQNTGTGFGCDKCSGPVTEWYG